MPEPIIRKARVTYDQPWYVQERFVDRFGAVVYQAAVATWDVMVFDTALEETVDVYSVTGNLPTATNGTVYTVLQTGNGWDTDATGYNFDYTLPSDAFERHGGHTYIVEFKFVFNAPDANLKGPVYLRYELFVEPVYSGTL